MPIKAHMVMLKKDKALFILSAVMHLLRVYVCVCACVRATKKSGPRKKVARESIGDSKVPATAKYRYYIKNALLDCFESTGDSKVPVTAKYRYCINNAYHVV